MRVLLFVTSVHGGGSMPVDPMLLVPDSPDAVLPPHPHGLEWQYFATTSLADQLLLEIRAEAEKALARDGHYIWGRTTQAAAGQPTRLLRSVRNALLVEDDFLVAAGLQSALEELGVGRVTTVATLEAAMLLLEAEVWDLAILDVLLNGETSYPIADLLFRRGTPFLFCTVLQELPKPYRDVPLLAKPFHSEQLERVLVAALRR